MRISATAIVLFALGWLPAAAAEPAQDPLVSAVREAHVLAAEVKAELAKPRPLFKAGFTLALSAPDKDWQAILAKIRNSGEYVEEDGIRPECFRLTDIRGSTTTDHIADYVSAWGFKDSEGVFQPGYASFVSEDWKLSATDKNWHFDQWVFEVNLYGEVAQFRHSMLVENDYGLVLKETTEDLDETSPVAKAKYAALIKHWSEFQPQETKQ